MSKVTDVLLELFELPAEAGETLRGIIGADFQDLGEIVRGV